MTTGTVATILVTPDEADVFRCKVVDIGITETCGRVDPNCVDHGTIRSQLASLKSHVVVLGRWMRLLEDLERGVICGAPWLVDSVREERDFWIAANDRDGDIYEDVVRHLSSLVAKFDQAAGRVEVPA